MIDGIVYALCSDNSAVVIYNPEGLDVPDQITVDEAVYTVTHATV